MRVVFRRRDIVDCTADPHPVQFDELNVALDAIERVCTDKIVKSVRSVNLEMSVASGDNEVFEADDLTTWQRDDEKRRQQTGTDSIRHKTFGLYLFSDATVSGDHHLPPGLTGVREAIKIIRKEPYRLRMFRVGVAWEFAGDGSCSDYITLPADESELCKEIVVDFSNQDWWIGSDGYRQHCANLSEVIGIGYVIQPSFAAKEVEEVEE